MPFRTYPRKRTIRAEAGEDHSLFAKVVPANGIVAHIDGGARGNPGPAGYGVMIRDAAGEPLAELSESLGRRTNNFAEYSALLAALEYALAHGHPALQVVSDSELLVKQMKGQYKVNNLDLKELHGRAHAMVRRLEHFTIRHVLRAQNKDADRLANAAMDRAMGRAEVSAGNPAAAGSRTADRELEGVVRDGRIELASPGWPEGTRVRIRPVK